MIPYNPIKPAKGTGHPQTPAQALAGRRNFTKMHLMSMQTKVNTPESVASSLILSDSARSRLKSALANALREHEVNFGKGAEASEAHNQKEQE